MKILLDEYVASVKMFGEGAFLDYLQGQYPHLYNALVLAVLDRLPK